MCRWCFSAAIQICFKLLRKQNNGIVAAKDQALRGKQREIDLLYGKLAAASPLTDAELRSTFVDALKRLAQQELPQA